MGERHVLSEMEIAKVSQYAARTFGGGTFLPVLVDLGSFLCAIFTSLSTSEVKVFLGWFSLARPIPFNTKMKTKSSLSPDVEKSELKNHNGQALSWPS